MGTVPREREIDVITFVEETCGEIDGHKERCVTVFRSMSYIPVAGCAVSIMADKVHGAHERDPFSESVRKSGIAVACAFAETEIGEIGRDARCISEHSVLGSGSGIGYTIRVECGRCRGYFALAS